jgi:hypothetical protein
VAGLTRVNCNTYAQRVNEEYTTEAYRERLGAFSRLINDFLFILSFVGRDAGRDPEWWDTHLLSYTAHDILESTFGILSLARDGLSNTCRRELRYLVELSIKVCYIEQHYQQLPFAEKFEAARRPLDSTNIGIKKNLSLSLLPEAFRSDFCEELGRLYGDASNWVHLSADQLSNRIDRTRRGVTAGREGLSEIDSLIGFSERCFAAIIVLILHSVPSWVAGDLLVREDGKTHLSQFEGSRYLAAIDEGFDYKHERQVSLAEIKARRSSLVRF